MGLGAFAASRARHAAAEQVQFLALEWCSPSSARPPTYKAELSAANPRKRKRERERERAIQEQEREVQERERDRGGEGNGGINGGEEEGAAAAGAQGVGEAPPGDGPSRRRGGRRRGDGGAGVAGDEDAAQDRARAALPAANVRSCCLHPSVLGLLANPHPIRFFFFGGLFTFFNFLFLCSCVQEREGHGRGEHLSDWPYGELMDKRINDFAPLQKITQSFCSLQKCKSLSFFLQ